MRVALNEAKKALGQTSPNPAVGAILVIDNRIVAKGIIWQRVAITPRLSAFEISARECLLAPRCTSLWSRAPQQGALLRAQMR